MPLKAEIKKHTFNFKTPGGTSRGVLNTKDSWYLILTNTNTGAVGIGECSILPKLSIDDLPNIETILTDVVNNIGLFVNNIELLEEKYPAICFALETALLDLHNGGKRIIFDTPFYNSSEGIDINGLIWMGDIAYMRKQLSEKIDAGFKCIKIKVGAIDFNEEIKLIASIRDNFNSDDLQLRLDANGAFAPSDALNKLEILSKYGIHSIEQPIAKGQHEQMAIICKESPIPIALDEELIGVHSFSDKKKLVKTINPQYLILKPSLLGGFNQCNQWIDAAKIYNVEWWLTSALEGNIGLNAIAQYASGLGVKMPQGLGTGQVFSNNLKSPLQIKNAQLIYNNNEQWESL